MINVSKRKRTFTNRDLLTASLLLIFCFAGFANSRELPSLLSNWDHKEAADDRRVHVRGYTKKDGTTSRRTLEACPEVGGRGRPQQQAVALVKTPAQIEMRFTLRWSAITVEESVAARPRRVLFSEIGHAPRRAIRAEDVPGTSSITCGRWIAEEQTRHRICNGRVLRTRRPKIERKGFAAEDICLS
jgi:hypothetical protein